MLAVIGNIKPGALIIWKTDRLGRARYDLAIVKKYAGCIVHYIAEPIEGDTPEFGKDRQRYVIDPVIVTFVWKIFENYVAGKTMVDIARELNDLGMATVRGKSFTVNSLAHLLNNRVYVGEYRYGDIVTPDGMPAIVS